MSTQTIVLEVPESSPTNPVENPEIAMQVGVTTEKVEQLEVKSEQWEIQIQALQQQVESQNRELMELHQRLAQTQQEVQQEPEVEIEVEMITPPEPTPEPTPEPEPVKGKETHWLMDWLLK